MSLALIGTGVSLISNIFGGFGARKRARRARRQAAEFEAKIRSFEANRQQVINPYENVKDLSGMISNPFTNLQVATKAAEIQGAEADISLATTLDTLRATGAGAGGATALAQAAARSKAGIAAGIEKQEAQNARLRAQGEQKMQQMRMSEAARVQSAQAQGAAFQFNAQESRDNIQLDRLSAQAGGARQQAAAYGNQARSMFGSALGSAAGILGGGLFGPNKGPGSFGKNLMYNFGSGNNNASGGNNTLGFSDWKQSQINNAGMNQAGLIGNLDLTRSAYRAYKRG